MHISFISWLESKNLSKEDTEKTAGIFFTNGRKVLLLQKPNKKWQLPGGHGKEGESAHETAKRECMEECGKIKGQNIGSIKNGNWTAFFYKIDKPFDCKLSDEHIDWKWFSLDKIKDAELTKKFRLNLDKHLNYLESLRERF